MESILGKFHNVNGPLDVQKRDLSGNAKVHGVRKMFEGDHEGRELVLWFVSSVHLHIATDQTIVEN